MCKRFRVILNILIVLQIRITSADSQFDVLRTPRSFEKQSRGIMSPKMDYDEWTPLGRGDPLKNDPTFDYSPPMVGKVKYWISPLLRTPDPPIVPIKELTTETSQITATITSSKTPNPKQSTDIKRFYIDFKDPSDMSYVQLMNNKYNNKFVRPQQTQYQNHYYNPTRPPPPPPLPMLVPPPPVEPNSYSPRNMSTTLALPWNSNKTQLPSIATTISYATTNPPPVTKSSFATPKPEVVAKTEIPFLKLLLDKETSESYRVTNPTTLKPLTPNPMSSFNHKYSHPSKAPSYLINQGHSKVKKYGTGKIERSDNVILQDTNDIGEPMKYELPKDMRGGRQLGVEGFLPFDGIFGETFKDFVSNQAEGSGFGAELTRVMFPSYIRPTPTLEYESPRMQEDEES